jgi:hypothetical protein
LERAGGYADRSGFGVPDEGAPARSNTGTAARPENKFGGEQPSGKGRAEASAQPFC